MSGVGVLKGWKKPMSDPLLENLVQDLIECVEFKYDIYRNMKAAGYHKHQLRQMAFIQEDWYDTVMAIHAYLGTECEEFRDRLYGVCGCKGGFYKSTEDRKVVKCGNCGEEVLRFWRKVVNEPPKDL